MNKMENNEQILNLGKPLYKIVYMSGFILFSLLYGIFNVYLLIIGYKPEQSASFLLNPYVRIVLCVIIIVSLFFQITKKSSYQLTQNKLIKTNDWEFNLSDIVNIDIKKVLLTTTMNIELINMPNEKIIINQNEIRMSIKKLSQEIKNRIEK